MKNPLLNINRLPEFSKIRPVHVEPAIDQVITENKKNLLALLENIDHVTWENLIIPLEEMDNRLSRVWSPVSHLNSVCNSEALRKAHEACLPKLSAYSTEMSQNEDLYRAYCALKNSDEFATLSQARKKTVENALLKFEISGVGLEPEKKQQFKEIKQRLSTLKSKFENNVLDATQAWRIHIEDEAELVGLPEYARGMAKQAAEEEELEGWVFTLDAPFFIAVMTYADKRPFREEMYTAYTTRASDQGPNAGEFDNSEIMEQILECRKELAGLLGYANYAELSIADKMAETTNSVMEFLNDLVEKSKSRALNEYKELKAFARSHDGLNNIKAWDIAYYAEKLKQKEYDITDEELKPYFPAEKVIQGLFDIVEKLYGIKVTRLKDIDVWHKDVAFYQITDGQGNLRGSFYLDLYARANKRGGAWMDECVRRMQCGETIQHPVAYLTCNLTPPVGGDPALLTHNEVTTLFHEFGHGLHHMLTRVNDLFVSGINGVEWDAVELPSQFMENWCWEKEGLALISGHYKTGEPLPEILFNKLIKAKNFQSAMFMLRQLEFSIFDFRLHMEYGQSNFESIQLLLNDVRQKVAVVIPPSFNRFQNGFSHIFAGGYSAGYYSYKWAEVLSADAFSKFEEKGIFDEATGREFLTEVLEKGGSAGAMELFKNFRGREPQIDALLRHSGLS
ncbi:MAG: oligopeptidase A [Gammaproteobacteria bacterium]|nr:oligopeptidase A [Gammaproteobacteria bacterium]